MGVAKQIVYLFGFSYLRATKFLVEGSVVLIRPKVR